MIAFAAVMPSFNLKVNTDWPVKAATTGPANLEKK